MYILAKTKTRICFTIISALLASCEPSSPVPTTIKVTYTANNGDVKPVTDTPFTVMPSCFGNNPNDNLPETYINYIRLTDSNEAGTYWTNSQGTFTTYLEEGTYCISNICIPEHGGEEWFNHAGNTTVGGCFLSYKASRSFPSVTTVELQNSSLYRTSC